jgi:hypothetical protein
MGSRESETDCEWIDSEREGERDGGREEGVGGGERVKLIVRGRGEIETRGLERYKYLNGGYKVCV